MDWKIFLSTFLLIFFAEFGDKTQLAVLAAAAEARSPLSVFLGAATALLLAIGLAILISSLFQQFVPPRFLQWASALLFLGFGFWTLYKIFVPTSKELAKNASFALGTIERKEPGLLSRWALNAALEFEEHARQDYERAAQLAQNESVRELFKWLSHEDHGHKQYVERLSNVSLKSVEQPPFASLTTVERPFVSPESEVGVDLDLKLLDQAAKHEICSHRFYRALAESLSFNKRLSSFFTRLAVEETEHLEKIESLRAKIVGTGRVRV